MRVTRNTKTMKLKKNKFVKTLLFTSIISLFYSCEEESSETLNTISTTSPTIQHETFPFTQNVFNGERTSITYNGNEIEVEKADDLFVLEGDIIIQPDSEVQNNTFSSKGTSVGRTTGRWDNNTVYYTIDNDLNNPTRVLDAIQHWEENTSIIFLERTSNQVTDYVTFTTGTGCSSYVGKIGGQQFVYLADACTTGNTIHEIGHVIGLWHEQSRKDRDEFIIIHYDNIAVGTEHNFQTYEEQLSDGEEYTDFFDFESIMMYHPFSFSDNNLPTITTIDGRIDYGYQATHLSEGDLIGINNMYPEIKSEGTNIREIKNPSFSQKRVYKLSLIHI